jgi:hypothetical protein
MPVERLREANQLLARPPLVGLSLSRALGLHVVGSLAARHGITVELRPGAPVGLVALITLPAAVLERTGSAVPPAEPVFAPDLGPDGEPTPLGARRVTWRPPDEPPVEQWRREAAPEDSPVAAASMTDAPFAAPVTEAPPAAAPEPEAEPEPEPVAPSMHDTHEEHAHDAHDAHAAEEDDAFADFDDAPLPTRVPGQHLSHQPLVEAGAPANEADPLRPYRVHELLTRHDLGKRKARGEAPPTEAPVPGSPAFDSNDPAPEGER